MQSHSSCRRFVFIIVVLTGNIFFNLSRGFASETPAINPESTPLSTTNASDTIEFAFLGDYGVNNSNQADVVALIESWNPDFIITGGDNVYQTALYDVSVGQHFCDYLTGVTSDSNTPSCNGGDSPVNRFFPTPGNHDYTDSKSAADRIRDPDIFNRRHIDISGYLNYFDLPGKGVKSTHTSKSELYYDVIQGPVHFFLINSEFSNYENEHPPEANEEQKKWLETELGRSTTPWQVVVFHSAAYSSGTHGSYEPMQWPFATWGADAVLTGHDHSYERIFQDGIVYFVNGLGGRKIYPFIKLIEGSQVRYNASHGAMKIMANDEGMTFQFITVDDVIIDRYSLGTSLMTETESLLIENSIAEIETPIVWERKFLPLAGVIVLIIIAMVYYQKKRHG